MQVNRTASSPVVAAAARSQAATPKAAASAPAAQASPLITPLDILMQKAPASSVGPTGHPVPATSAPKSARAASSGPGIDLLKGNLINIVA